MGKQKITMMWHLNAVIEDFAREYTELFNTYPLEGPPPQVLGKLLADYHKQIAPYIKSYQPELFNTLQLWSANTIDDGRGRNIVEVHTGRENGTELGYLWGLHISHEEAQEFARNLQQDSEYDMELLPPALKPYIEIDPELSQPTH